MARLLTVLGIAGVAVMATAPAASAALSARDFALGAQFGTEGIGGQLETSLVPHTLDLNIGISRFSHSQSFTADSTKFDAHVRLGGEPIGVSWFPFHGGFKINAGVLINSNRARVDGSSNSNGSYTINGHTYTGSEVGTLTGATNFRTVAPYVGIGYGDPFAGGRLTFTVNAGVAFEGSPNAHLAASNGANNPQLAADIASEQRMVNHKLNVLQYWPQVMLGIAYRF